jgi:hypothetical protein
VAFVDSQHHIVNVVGHEVWNFTTTLILLKDWKKFLSGIFLLRPSCFDVINYLSTTIRTARLQCFRIIELRLTTIASHLLFYSRTSESFFLFVFVVVVLSGQL